MVTMSPKRSNTPKVAPCLSTAVRSSVGAEVASTYHSSTMRTVSSARGASRTLASLRRAGGGTRVRSLLNCAFSCIRGPPGGLEGLPGRRDDALVDAQIVSRHPLDREALFEHPPTRAAIERIQPLHG